MAKTQPAASGTTSVSGNTLASISALINAPAPAKAPKAESKSARVKTPEALNLQAQVIDALVANGGIGVSSTGNLTFMVKGTLPDGRMCGGSIWIKVK